MRVHKRKVVVRLVESSMVNNGRLVEYLANKYRTERIMKDGNL